jgi:hypothetical protein
MLELTRSFLSNQMHGALTMLQRAIEACPDTHWNERVGDLKFCQVAFHTLFFVDCYLSENTDAMLAQPFHQENKDFFRDYDEMKDSIQVLLYERADIDRYFAFCRQKATDVIAAETAESLAAPAGFEWLPFSRAELHVYNTRHIQHHAAQLSLRLRLDHGDGIKWSRAGDL